MAKKKKPDKLAQDVAAATAAGLSYGQWKAMQPPSNPHKPPEGFKACKRCGKLFKPRATQVYCNDECQYLARLDAKRKKD
jgi:hypothetical protein